MSTLLGTLEKEKYTLLKNYAYRKKIKAVDFSKKLCVLILKEEHDLTEKEASILPCLFKCDEKVSSKKEIAFELNKSINTVNHHFTNLYRKFKVDNYTDFILKVKPYLT